nr:uncharacterized protein LOC112701685 [Arachis hypogaea]
MEFKKDVPKVGMCFGTIEDANQFYQNYAKRVGFVTKIRFTRRVGKDKVPKNQIITCNREGKCKSRVSLIEKTNPRINYNCPARISIRLNKEGLRIISKVCLDHSHPCDPEIAKLLTRNREMSMHMCRVIERNDEAGVRPSKTYQVLMGEARGFSNINLMKKDVRNYLSRKVCNVTEEMDAREMLKYFTRMKDMNSDFYFDVELDQNKRLKTIFWADARSRAAYEYFGDVVSFDTTYKTNRYDMPFGSFVGLITMISMKKDIDGFQFFLTTFFGLKEQQEREADVEDYKSIIPCATNSLIEKQFQSAYTNAKFKEVQKQIRKKANCILHLMKAVSTSKVYSILEDVSNSKERVYEVNYNAKTKDITCKCQMFESRGILCSYSLVVLGNEHVREISRRYILDRWSKLVKRRHSDIKSSHDPSLLNLKTEKFDDLCSHSNNVAQFASQTKETSDILHRYLDMAMSECQKHIANSSSNANELDNLLTLEDGGKDALSIFLQDANYHVNEGFESDSMGGSMGRFMSLLNSIHSYKFSNVD